MHLPSSEFNGRILKPTPPDSPSPLPRTNEWGDRASERTSQPGKRTTLPARTSRGEGVANSVSWWRYQDVPEFSRLLESSAFLDPHGWLTQVLDRPLSGRL